MTMQVTTEQNKTLLDLRIPYIGLYDVIRDGELNLAREMVNAGHDRRGELYSGTIVDLAVKHGDLDFIKFVIEKVRPIDKWRQSVLEEIIVRMDIAADDDDQRNYYRSWNTF